MDGVLEIASNGGTHTIHQRLYASLDLQATSSHVLASRTTLGLFGRQLRRLTKALAALTKALAALTKALAAVLDPNGPTHATEASKSFRKVSF